MTRQLRRTRPAGDRFHPHVEALEHRATPAVTALLTPTTLTITGTNGRDVVTVIDQGNNPGAGGATPQIFVLSNGVVIAQGSSVNLTTVSFQMKGGADLLFYSLSNFSKASTGSLGRAIGGTMGSGDDLFRLSADNLGDIQSLSLNASGNSGDDTMSTAFTPGGSSGVATSASFVINGNAGDDVLFASAVGTQGQGAHIEEGDAVTVNLSGGKDDDTIGGFGFLDLDGVLTFNMSGNNGDDVLDGDFRITPQSGFTGAVANSTKGVLNVTESGNNGDDSLRLLIVNNSTNVTVTATADGGNGKDTANTTGSNVGIVIISIP